MNGAVSLADRYRRLLALYPEEHRGKHQDEMLGVLMTGARAGQQRPGLTETADLVWGALLIRLRPARPGTAWPRWRDALAVVSVLLPLAYLASVTASVITAMTPHTESHAAWTALLQSVLVSGGAWILLTALVLLRLRRTAALITAGLLIWFLIITAGAPDWTGIGPDAMLITAVLGLELAALLASAGPRAGMMLMTWRYYALAVLVPAALACVTSWLWVPHPLLADATMVAVVTITLAAMTVATPLSRRAALALSIPAYYLVAGQLVLPSVSGPGNQSGWLGPLRVTVTVLPFAALLCVALVAARRAAAGGREA